MDLYSIPTSKLLFNLVLYACLPLWLIFGGLDWYCHKRSKIETTTGIKESMYHAIMGVQVGIPVFLGLYFEINVLLLLLMFGVLIAHEWVAHRDVSYALNTREISVLEIHVHSFLECLPFVIVMLIICINWPAFVDLITFNWGGHLQLVLKAEPLQKSYIAAYVGLMLFADIIPFVEELYRCWRHRKELAAKQKTQEVGLNSP